MPVLALSQLSRAVEQREDKRPQLSDLRESGSIEQDADIVLFVYREEYYVASHEPKRPVEGDDAKIFESYEQWQRDMERVYQLAELIVAKQRHGATGKVKLKFEAKITRFSDHATRPISAGDARLTVPLRYSIIVARSDPRPSVRRTIMTEGIYGVSRDVLLAGIAGGDAARPRSRAQTAERRRRTIPSPGSRRSRASGRWPGRATRMRARSASLQGDPRYQQILRPRARPSCRRATASRSSSFRPDGLYNFWQDADHVRGILRRTTLASYRTDDPQWETVLDVDALAAAEGKSWVYQGMQCLPPEERRCLVTLSDGGRDANVVREFDLRERRFVDGGFSLPEGKQNVDLGGREHDPRRARLGAGDDDRVRLSVRDQAAAARADASTRREEVYRGTAERRAAPAPMVLRDSDGRVHGDRRLSRRRLLPQPVRACSARAAMSRLPIPQRASLAGHRRRPAAGHARRALGGGPGPALRDRFDRLLRSRRMEARSAAPPGRAWSGRRGRGRR